MFNWSNIVKRSTTGEFQMVPTGRPRPSKKPNHPKDTRSQHLLFTNRNGAEVATAHYYVCQTGQVTPPDPKTLKIGDIRYTIHPDRATANPENSLPFVWMRKIFGAAMKLKCRVFGPIAVLPEIRLLMCSLP